MKKYISTETVHAKIFERGDEDGMSCIPLVSECKWKNKEGKYKDCTNCTLDIPKIPYIKILGSDVIYSKWDINYLCHGNAGDRWFVYISVFENKYKEID